MKRLFALILMLCVLVGCSTGALAAGQNSLLSKSAMPLSIALKKVAAGNAPDRILLTDDFSRFDYFGSDYLTSVEDEKILILWREAPIPDYVRQREPIGDDYQPKNLDSPKVYLCADMMAKLPEERRATSPEDADVLMMVETIYPLTAVITQTEGGKKDDIPSTWELQMAMLGENTAEETLAEEEEEIALYYTPCYDGVIVLALYDWNSGDSISLATERFDMPELRNNPEAGDVWERMYNLLVIHDAALNEEPDDLVSSTLMQADLAEEDIIYFMEAASVSSDIPALCLERFWELADELKQIDDEAAELYELAISQNSVSGMIYVANQRRYNGVDMDDDIIRSTRSYVGQIDRAQMEVYLADGMDTFEQIDWSISLAVEVLAESE